MFLDAFALIALINKSDAAHARAREVMHSLGIARTPLVTSQWVLTEFLASCSRPPLRRAAVALADTLLESKHVMIVPAGNDEWLDGFTAYRTHADKSWSLVDCTSILICRELQVRRVLTHDRHFRQAGLEILL